MTRKRERRLKVNGLTVVVPYYCECGGTLQYQVDFGRIFNYCDKCTPVQHISIERVAHALKEKGDTL